MVQLDLAHSIKTSSSTTNKYEQKRTIQQRGYTSPSISLYFNDIALAHF